MIVIVTFYLNMYVDFKGFFTMSDLILLSLVHACDLFRDTFFYSDRNSQSIFTS